MKPFYHAKPVRDPKWETAITEYLTKQCGYSEAEARKQIDLACRSPVVKNDKYQVVIEEQGGGWVHLSIKRLDKQPVHDWRELQQIKNMLVGPECEGLELYPAESRVVDTANQYHLYVMRDPTWRLPVGYETGLRCDKEMLGAKQRPFEKDG